MAVAGFSLCEGTGSSSTSLIVMDVRRGEGGLVASYQKVSGQVTPKNKMQTEGVEVTTEISTKEISAEASALSEDVCAYDTRKGRPFFSRLAFSALRFRWLKEFNCLSCWA